MGSKICFVLLFSLFSSAAKAEKPNLNHLLLTPKDGSNFFGGLPGLGEPLTAAEVKRDGWVIDPEGSCVAGKGCQYMSPATGVRRFLPLDQKKLLEKETLKTEAAAPVAPSPKGIVELPTVEAYHEQFKTDKKVLHFVFTAVDCGGCKVLKGQLNKLSLKENSIFTLTRPRYIEFAGHPAHEEFSQWVSSVPVMFRYTKKDDGTWASEKFSGSAIYETLKKVK